MVKKVACSSAEIGDPSRDTDWGLGKAIRNPPLISVSVDGLYGYALVLSRNRTEAEDLVQETCLRALRAMERLRPDSKRRLFGTPLHFTRPQLSLSTKSP